MEELERSIAMDDYHHQGQLPNNFMQTLSSADQAFRTINTFKDEYLLDYINQVEGKEIESFTTGSTDSFTFALIGDPQIGSSNELKAKRPDDLTDEFYEVQSDSVASGSYNWANTLTQAVEMCTALGDNLELRSDGPPAELHCGKMAGGCTDLHTDRGDRHHAYNQYLSQ
ncbi:MAG: hypothetical protein LUI87_05215 [Lachnospiraceae bacterium]|nr:hypothetical protein [Lachnospiraceae bacterium]